MNKKIKITVLALGILATTAISAIASQGPTVSGQSGDGTGYSGYVKGDKDLWDCYGATYTIRTKGESDVYAWVEIVNADGNRIGKGAENTGKEKAYSGTVTRAGGKNAYGSVGTATGTISRTFTSLF